MCNEIFLVVIQINYVIKKFHFLYISGMINEVVFENWRDDKPTCDEIERFRKKALKAKFRSVFH